MGLKKTFNPLQPVVPDLVNKVLDGQNTTAGPNLTTIVPFNSSTTTTAQTETNGSAFTVSLPPCQWILYEDIGESHVRIWDLMILIPNTLYMICLLMRIMSAVRKLRSSRSPIFTLFYGLVWVVVGISIIRCVVAMIVNPGNLVDKILWLVLRFFLLATEMSVVVFGLAFGHLDSYTSIKWVLPITVLLALGYSVTQGTLEILHPDEKFHVHGENYDIFAHGGMIFWFASSIFFFVIYLAIVILPHTPLRARLQLPTKKTFYVYCGFLAVLNMLQAIGSGLLEYGEIHGMCVVDLTTYLYFTLFAPLVYMTFLWKFFGKPRLTLLFSYKNHQDDDVNEEDNVSLPYHQAQESLHTRQGIAPSSGYDSTHFDTNSGAESGTEDNDPVKNPLYEHSNSINADIEVSINGDLNSDSFNRNEIT